MKKNIIIFPILALSITSCNQFPSHSFTTSQYVCEHSLLETVIKEPSLLETGLNEIRCVKCGETFTKTTYDLSQCVFEDGFYMYDGQDHALSIKGLLPYGATVEYENNSLKEIGQKEATAKIFNESHELIETKKAHINIIENTGFANIYIDTNNAPIEDKENYVPMTMKIDNCSSKYLLNDVQGNIRLRGNGTLTYDKKAYRLKLDSKANLLGLNNNAKCKSWVLIADYADQSMMRNASAYYLGNSLFNYSNNYSTDYQHVNVYLNGSYNGVYLLAEQQQVNANRINIKEPETNSTTTDIGYLLELDNYAKQEEYYFTIGSSSSGGFGGYPGFGGGENINGITIPSKDYTIKNDIYSQEQVNYIKKYLTNVFSAFKSVFKDGTLKTLDENHNLIDSPYSSQYETLNSMIDLESLFKMYILQEYMKDIDVGFSSFYMFVDFSMTSKYPRLTFGAPWDFDWSSGNVNNTSIASPNGEFNSTDFDHKNVWLLLLSKTDFFRDMMAKYYSIFVNSGILEGAIAQANYEAVAFANEFATNYSKWKTLGTIVPKYTPDVAKTYKVHKDAVDYLVKWLLDRKTSLDTIFLVKEELSQ